MIPADVTAWERRLGLYLRAHGWPDLALEWLFVLRPRRLAQLALVLALAPVASAAGVGPLFLLGAILAVMLTNLGTRRPGEASAYSIFNPGVRRLPGQLDMDAVDQQIRRGNI